MTFVMVNPSTADASEDDATIRKCIGFAKKHGYGAIRVVNLFAYRSTDVKALKDVVDPVGPRNDIHILAALRDRSKTVVAWGSRTKLPKELQVRIDEMWDILASRGPVYHLGGTKSGDPKHPLMVAYTTPLLRCNLDVL